MRKLVALLCIASLATAACPAPRRPVPLPDIERAWEALDAHCAAHGDDQVLCNKPGFLEGRAACARTYGAARKYKARLEAAEEHGSIDGAVHAGEVTELRVELDTERMRKWIALGIGFAVGALAVGVPVGIAR